jgi:hypothetical protein
MAKTRIKQILKKVSDDYYANQLVKSYNARINGIFKANSDLSNYELSGEEIKKVKDFWRKYKIRPNLKWIKAYSYAFGKFSEKFIPDDVYFLYIEPYLNNLFFSAAFSDKNNYDRFFSDIKTPRSILRRIHGKYYDDNYKFLNNQDLEDYIRNFKGTYIIKPTLVDGGGKNIKKLKIDFPNGTIDGMDQFNLIQYLRGYDNNYQIQEIVKQHPAIAEIHPDSLNCIRVLSLRRENKIIILSSVAKFGSGGSFLDGQRQGGVNCAIDKDGRVNQYAFNDKKFSKISIHPDTRKRFGDLVIPGYQGLLDKITKLHEPLLHQDLVSWDMSLSPEGEPILIEINLNSQAIALQQANNGPLFGKYTREILDAVFQSPKPRVYIRIAN